VYIDIVVRWGERGKGAVNFLGASSLIIE